MCGGHSDGRTKLGPSKTSPPSEDDRWAAVISEATQHVRTDGADVKKSPNPKRVQRILLGVLMGAWAAFLTMRLAEPQSASLPINTQAADLRIEAALLIEQINAYWEERGTLPDPIALSPYLDEGYEYQIVDPTQGRFVVRRASGGVTVTFDGSIPLNLWILLGGQATGGGP